MKLKNNYFFTLRENVKDEDSRSGELLVRSGMIKKSSAGVYMYLPLGYRVLKNIENIIREEMENIGTLELLMPTLISKDIYETSGRVKVFGDSVFALKDRFNRDYILGPTHEELFTIASTFNIKSYKDMPYALYQFQNKFRDEPRPRYGLIRVREFIMKDAYTFDKDLKGLDESYGKMYKAYQNAFDRMGLKYKVVTADTGVMGGLLSEEFQAEAEIGEDILVLCDSCDYASNIEVSKCVNNTIMAKEDKLNMQLVETINQKTIEEISSFLKKPKDKFVKTLIYMIDKEPYAILVKGDDDVNEIKLAKLLNATMVELADFDTVERITNAKVGFAGPIDIGIKIVMDNEILEMKNFVVGANKTDYHYVDVNLSDFKHDLVGDIRNIKEGDVCPKCGGKIYFKKGIEVGNTFKLGTKYSEKLGLNYLDENNKLQPVVMGSYGIGLGRCIAALVEQNNDDKGIIWPLNVAPFKCCIVVVDIKNEEQMKLANNIYNSLLEKGIEPLLDDREERFGVKLNDMDLIGIPVRVVVGKKANENIVELKYRNKEEVIETDIQEKKSYF
ncbi:MAG TPA: proline--tRNA ligase, partial [Bacilli bacterium]|nr:proline--tRNA ligase [Bacilli bacterium]